MCVHYLCACEHRTQVDGAKVMIPPNKAVAIVTNLEALSLSECRGRERGFLTWFQEI